MYMYTQSTVGKGIPVNNIHQCKEYLSKDIDSLFWSNINIVEQVNGKACIKKLGVDLELAPINFDEAFSYAKEFAFNKSDMLTDLLTNADIKTHITRDFIIHSETCLNTFIASNSTKVADINSLVASINPLNNNLIIMNLVDFKKYLADKTIKFNEVKQRYEIQGIAVAIVRVDKPALVVPEALYYRSISNTEEIRDTETIRAGLIKYGVIGDKAFNSMEVIYSL